jgi:hypothetical protein
MAEATRLGDAAMVDHLIEEKQKLERAAIRD